MADETPTPEATINVVDRYGEQTAIPLSQLAMAKERGYRIATGEEVHGKQLQEQYTGTLPTIEAFGGGLARGASFGVSDIGAAPEAALLRQYNPLAAGLGETAGFLGSAAATGLGRAAGAAGQALFSGSGILARAGAAAVRTGLEGAAMGAGQGISDVALAKDPMSAEAIAGTLTHHIFTGAALGAATGAGVTLGAAGLGAAIGKAGKVVTKLADKYKDELVEDSGGALATAEPALRDEIMAMSRPQLEAARTAEETALKTTRAQDGTQLAADIRQFDLETKDQLYLWRKEPDKDLMRRAIAPGKALGKVVDDPKTLAEQPGLALGPLRRMEVQVQELAKKLPEGSADPILQKLSGLQDRIANATGDITSPRLEALDARLDQLTAGPKATPLIDASLQAGGAAVGGALGHATGIPYAGMAGAFLGKELSSALKPLAKKIVGAFVDHASAIQDGAEGLASKLAAPSPAMDALRELAGAGAVQGANEYERATKAITQAAANPQATAAHLSQQLAGLAQAAPQLAQQVQDGLMLKLNFLASKVTPQVSMGLTGKLIPPSDMEQAQFARYVAAANDPLRLIKELRAGMLMPETVETHEAVFPAITGRFKGALAEQLADPKVAASVPYSMRLQLGMLLGPQADPTLDPSFIGLMQQTFAQPPPGGKAPGNATTTNAAQNATSAQRLTMR